MVLWIGFALLAAAVVWAVTRPLLARSSTGLAQADTELAVYRDQLEEIDRERAQGLIAGTEADDARAEVGRRLIRSAEESERGKDAQPVKGTGWNARAVIYTAAALPIVALGLYLAVGSPSMPARPYASRINEPLDKASASDLVAKVEAHLRQNPNDGRGWDVLAPVYMRMGNFPQAADAFSRAIALLGESPQRLAGFARASIMVDNGVVGEPARRAFDKLLKLDPKAIEPQVWLAIAREQDGDLKGAAADYKRLLAEAGDDSPWKRMLEPRLKAVEANLAEPPAPGQPSAEAMADAKSKFHHMTPEQRQEFIERMVGDLAQRLKENNKDLQGWMQLMRAYTVLGRPQEAQSALADARRSFDGDEKALAQLQELAQILGIGS